jgi:hypothetical protein
MLCSSFARAYTAPSRPAFPTSTFSHLSSKTCLSTIIMDIEPPQSPQPPPPTQEAQFISNSNAQDKLLLKLSALLEQLEANPDSVPLIKQQIQLMNELQMVPEVLDATLRLASLVMLSEGMSASEVPILTSDQWLSHMDLLISTSPQPLGLEQFVTILERFEQAEQDYLCKFPDADGAEYSSRTTPTSH